MRWVLVASIVLSAAVAEAHKPSDSYVRLGEPVTSDGRTKIALRWDVALRDLDRALGVDANRDGAITWGEVRMSDTSARALLRSHLTASLDGAPCSLEDRTGRAPQITGHSDGAYAVYAFELDCPEGHARLRLEYSLLFDLDPQHRGLVRSPDGQELVVLSRQTRSAEVPLPKAQTRGDRLSSAIGEGIHHIWTGYDHLLFLLALLLPSVLRREQGRWLPVERLRPAVVDVFKVVTAFTAAHSVTLSLAAMGVLALPSRLVESAIAASVVLAALNNLWPLVRADRWLAAFALGLLHGFGFSSTLADLGLAPSALLPTLVGFNLGVEIGQAAVVALFVPIAFMMRRRDVYRWGALQLGSAVIAVVAALWFIQRAFGLSILPG